MVNVGDSVVIVTENVARIRGQGLDLILTRRIDAADDEEFSLRVEGEEEVIEFSRDEAEAFILVLDTMLHLGLSND